MLIYVMGRGHSGSTLLDNVLSADDEVEGVGELVSGMGRDQARCSCGDTIGECSFWTAVRAETVRTTGHSWADTVACNRRQARVPVWPLTFARSVRSARVREERDELVAPLQAVRTVAGVGTVVDSSKEVTRALFFGRFVPGVVLVHLVRRPVDVVASDLHRIRGGTYRFYRRQIPTGGVQLPFVLLSSVMWVATNVLCELVARRGRAAVVRVRYEDLCADPAAVVRKVGVAAGRSFPAGEQRVGDGEALSFGHKVGGNAVRLEGPAAVRGADAHKRPITRTQQRLVLAVTSVLRGRYGY